MSNVVTKVLEVEDILFVRHLPLKKTALAALRASLQSLGTGYKAALSRGGKQRPADVHTLLGSSCQLLLLAEHQLRDKELFIKSTAIFSRLRMLETALAELAFIRLPAYASADGILGDESMETDEKESSLDDIWTALPDRSVDGEHGATATTFLLVPIPSCGWSAPIDTNLPAPDYGSVGDVFRHASLPSRMSGERGAITVEQFGHPSSYWRSGGTEVL